MPTNNKFDFGSPVIPEQRFSESLSDQQDYMVLPDHESHLSLSGSKNRRSTVSGTGRHDSNNYDHNINVTVTKSITMGSRSIMESKYFPNSRVDTIPNPNDKDFEQNNLRQSDLITSNFPALVLPIPSDT